MTFINWLTPIIPQH